MKKLKQLILRQLLKAELAHAASRLKIAIDMCGHHTDGPFAVALCLFEVRYALLCDLTGIEPKLSKELVKVLDENSQS